MTQNKKELTNVPLSLLISWISHQDAEISDDDIATMIKKLSSNEDLWAIIYEASKKIDLFIKKEYPEMSSVIFAVRPNMIVPVENEVLQKDISDFGTTLLQGFIELYNQQTQEKGDK